MEKLTITTSKRDKILNILSSYGFSYSYASKLLRNKDVRIDDIKIKDNIMVDNGSVITVFYNKEFLNEKEIEIIYQDENVVIVNKPTNIEVVGNEGLEKKLNALAVHRLDRNTTGLTILAKNKASQKILLDAFKNHNVAKKYLAEVVGKTNYKNYLMKAYLVKDAKQSFVKIYEKEEKGSVEIKTIFNTIKSNPTSSIIDCTLITGKTHQIRASLSYLGHPIIGDGKYGKNEDNKKFKQKTQRLHCYYLKFENLKEPLKYLNNKEFISKPSWQNY